MKRILIASLLALSLTLTACGKAPPPDSIPEENLKTFTLEELAQYDGQNGNPAYIAVDGVVYEVKWKDGQHYGLSAGNDLSEAIKAAPHGTAVLSKLKIVGALAEDDSLSSE